MKAVEKHLRAELRALPESVASSSLAKAALKVAQRIDGDPGDDAMVRLVRELRLCTAELHGRTPEDPTADVERFLADITEPNLGNASH